MPLPAALVAFSPGTVVKSAEVNQNFTALRDNLSNFVVYTDVPRTITVKHVIQLVGPQLQIGVDGSNFFTVNVGATGLVTLDAVGAGAGFTFSDPVTVSGTLTATTLAGTLSTAAQPNVTSLGTLTGLTVSGGAVFAGAVSGVTTLSIDVGSVAGYFARKHTDAATGAVATEVTLFSTTVTGGLLGANGIIRLTGAFTLTGTLNTKTFRVKYGATTFATFTYLAGTTGSKTFDIFIANRNLTNSQFAQGHITGDSTTQERVGTTVGVNDSTVNQTLAVTGQTADAADELTLQIASVVLLPAS